MGALTRYFQLTQDQQAIQGGLQQPQQQQQIPQIDTSDALNSLAGQLVTPAEREAREQKMLENKRKMIAWTGLFDGLRQLGNLYYTTQGATPQQFTDKPYQQIEANYQAEMNRQDALDKNRDNYVKNLWTLQRQGLEDARKKALVDAQLKWYDTRDEMSRLKAENERIKTEKYVQLQDGRIAKINAETGQIEALTPYKVDTEKSKAEKNRQLGNAAQIRANVTASGTETTVMKPDGSVTKTIKKPVRSSGGPSSGNKYSKYKKGSSTGGSESSGKYDKYKKPKK